MEGYEIRTAVPADAEALYRFGETLLGETSYFLRGPGERARSVDEMRSVIERFEALPHYLLLNAWHGAEAVGEAVAMGGDFARNKYTATVGIGVLAAHGARGLGRTLMRELDGFARENGLHRLELTVMAHNTVARSLYAKMGYVEEGTKRDSLSVDGGFVSEIMMAKVFA
jgi:RimJ/RimL family protein N-acetyltransferase